MTAHHPTIPQQPRPAPEPRHARPRAPDQLNPPGAPAGPPGRSTSNSSAPSCLSTAPASAPAGPGGSSLRFRNVDADPSDEVTTWPFEALVAAIDRGLVDDWRPIFAEIRRSPWGPVARRVERYLAYRSPDGAGTLFALAIDSAREAARRADRDAVTARIET